MKYHKQNNSFHWKESYVLWIPLFHIFRCHLRLIETKCWFLSISKSFRKTFLNFIPNPISEQHTDFNFANAAYPPSCLWHMDTKFRVWRPDSIALLLMVSSSLCILYTLWSLFWVLCYGFSSPAPTQLFTIPACQPWTNWSIPILNSPSDRMLTLKIMRSPWWIFEVRL